MRSTLENLPKRPAARKHLRKSPMKYLRLVWLGLWRTPLRTVTNLISLVVFFVIFGIGNGIKARFDAVVAGMNPNNLRVYSSTSFSDPLPYGYRSKIEQISGVQSVTPISFLRGYFGDPKSRGWAAAVDVGTWPTTMPEKTVLSSVDYKRWATTRIGAVVGKQLAAEHNWKIGDRVSLTSTTYPRANGSSVWPFEIVGIYKRTDVPEWANEVWFDYRYFAASRLPVGNGVNMFAVRVARTNELRNVAAAVTNEFANSSDPVEVQSESEWVRAAIREVADISLLVHAVVGANLFILLVLLGTSLWQSFRERETDLAIMKAIGFSDSKVFALCVAEGLTLCLAGAVLGLCVSSAIFQRVTRELDLGTMPGTIWLEAFALAALVALVASFMPAVRARRLTVIEQLSAT